MAAGYSGWGFLIDEGGLGSRYSLRERAKFYGELARWMGKLEESNYAGLAVVSSITADFQSKVLEGIDDFEKVPGRLTAILGEGMKNRLSLDFLLGGCFSTQEVRGKWQP